MRTKTIIISSMVTIIILLFCLAIVVLKPQGRISDEQRRIRLINHTSIVLSETSDASTENYDNEVHTLRYPSMYKMFYNNWMSDEFLSEHYWIDIKDCLLGNGLGDMFYPFIFMLPDGDEQCFYLVTTYDTGQSVTERSNYFPFELRKYEKQYLFDLLDWCGNPISELQIPYEILAIYSINKDPENEYKYIITLDENSVQY